MHCPLCPGTFVGKMVGCDWFLKCPLLPRIKLPRKSLWRSLSAPSLHSHLISEDKLWCPIRALKYYVDRTKSHRKHDQLFLTCKDPFVPASKDTVSRWIVNAIKAAGQEAMVDSALLHAHDTRGISTSWALFAGLPQADILKAAYWSSPNSFISYYLRVSLLRRLFSLRQLWPH